MAQTHLAQAAMEMACPDVKIRILPMKTTGDKILDRPLEKIGGKGLFVKELDRALIEARTDASVHSLKDLPMEENEALPVYAYLKREDPRDALVLPKSVSEIDFSKPVGTGSKRRILQLQALFPRARFAPLRGNIVTRLRRLDEGQYGAIVLAAAGLKRMGLETRVSRYFSPDEVIPAAGQGIIAVQGRADASPDLRGVFGGINDAASECAAVCERAFVRACGGGCTMPSAAYAEVRGDQIHLRGLYYDESSGQWAVGEISGVCAGAAECEALGIGLAQRLMCSCAVK